jgi:hypothetical protein
MGKQMSSQIGLLAFFDFLSHPTMHLRFNEGYLKVLHAAFPGDTILVCAAEGHLENLRPALLGLDRMEFVPVAPLGVARSAKAHNPWKGRRSAKRCWAEVERVLAGRTPKLGALGGMDANLLAVFRDKWRRFPGVPLHYALHNHLESAKGWRTRNPILRQFDFLNVFRKPLPPGQFILALELSIAESIETEFPDHRGRVLTIEHPVLESEWGTPRPPSPDGPVRVGFTGHCGRGKGFAFFVHLSDRFSGEKLEFHAIGRKNPNIGDMDLSSLARAPAPEGLTQEEFVEALQSMDLVCLPLRPETRYVASGSIADAFAAAKPLVVTTNPMIRAIARKYGEFGRVVPDRDGVRAFFEAFDRETTLGDYGRWLEGITRIREGRRTSSLAVAYRDMVGKPFVWTATADSILATAATLLTY